MKVQVEIIESERGWGTRVEEVREFKTLAEAEKFCRQYNRENCPPTEHVPDCYVMARVRDLGFWLRRASADRGDVK